LAYKENAEWFYQHFPEIQTEYARQIVVIHNQTIIFSYLDPQEGLPRLSAMIRGNPDSNQFFIHYVKRPNEIILGFVEGAVSRPSFYFSRHNVKILLY